MRSNILSACRGCGTSDTLNNINYNLLTADKLDSYLADIDKRARFLFDEMIKSLAEKENITEKLKADKPMLWVQKMNNIRNRATEIVNSEIIYK